MFQIPNPSLKALKQFNNMTNEKEKHICLPEYLLPICRFGQNCWLEFINEITKKTLGRKVRVDDKELRDIQYWTSLTNNDYLKVKVAAYMYLELSDRLSRIEKLIKSNNKSSKSKEKLVKKIIYKKILKGEVMKQESTKSSSLTDILFDEIDKLNKCTTEEEIRTESVRADMLSDIADKLIRYGELQVKAFDVIGDSYSKNNLKRLC